jgi:hypothetical protein
MWCLLGERGANGTFTFLDAVGALLTERIPDQWRSRAKGPRRRARQREGVALARGTHHWPRGGPAASGSFHITTSSALAVMLRFGLIFASANSRISRSAASVVACIWHRAEQNTREAARLLSMTVVPHPAQGRGEY